MRRDREPDRSDDPMLGALHANGPFPEHAGKLLSGFGRLIGSWEIGDVHFDRDGGVRFSRVGEWLWGWVLEGRAVQDVILSPPRNDGSAPRYEYGTTVRLYDPSIDAWHVTFIAPIAGAVVQLVARVQGDDIVQTGTAPGGKLLRWVFSDISRDAFTWRGYESTDGGGSWFMEEEIRARRHDA